MIRASESGLIVVAVLIGTGAGLMTTALSRAAALMHHILYGHAALSATVALDTPMVRPDSRGRRPRARVGQPRHPRAFAAVVPVDPIEANALQGGRMSVTDSLFIGAQTLLSNGCGASVGLEAGLHAARVGPGVVARAQVSISVARICG